MCSTNNRPGLTESKAEQIECDTVVRGNERF
jgi:hypothetical protein